MMQDDSNSSRRHGPIRRRTVLLAIAFVVLIVGTGGSGSGCAWGYAGQEGEKEKTNNVKGDPNLVEVDDEDDEEDEDDEASERQSDAVDSEDGDDPTAEADAQSPCGIRTFEVHYFDSSTQVTKQIDCTQREVVSVNRSPIGQQKLRSAEHAGLPESTWYLLVDPKGVRSKFLTNDQLIKISQEFKIQFLGRDEKRNLLIYEYRGDL